MDVVKTLRTPRWAGFNGVGKALERGLLALVVGCYFLLDVVTTIIGQELGAYESTASIRWMMEQFGYAGLVAHKLVIVGSVLLGWYVLVRVSDEIGVDGHWYRALFLVFFAYRGTSVVVWNCYFIAHMILFGTMPSAPAWL